VRRRTDFRAGLYETRSVTQGHGAIELSRTHRQDMGQVDEVQRQRAEQGTASAVMAV